MEKWKRLSSKQLLDHPRLSIFEDDVELPSGHKTQYVYYKKPDASCAIAVNHEGKILLQKEYSYPPNEWLYQFPGGAFEKGESAIDCARRELAEEASLGGNLEELGWYYADNRRCSARFYVFMATNIQPAVAKKDAEEEFVDYWFTENEIDAMIRSGKITNYSMLSAWAIYKVRN